MKGPKQEVEVDGLRVQEFKGSGVEEKKRPHPQKTRVGHPKVEEEERSWPGGSQAPT